MRFSLQIVMAFLCMQSVAALEIGDIAPAIPNLNVVKGTPAAEDSGKWRVVEFWATWCGPCVQNIPHLTELQSEYAEYIHITGISDEDKTTVVPFVEKQGDRMNYCVVYTDRANYAETYGPLFQGIPHAFLISPDGEFLWHGHPGEMDVILKQAIAGTYDIEAAKRKAEAQKQSAGLEEALQKSFQTNDLEKISKAADALLAIVPVHEQGMNVKKIIAQQKNDPSIWRKTLEHIEIENLSGEELNSVAWLLVTEEHLLYRNVDLAVHFAEIAVEKSPDNSALLDTLARAYYVAGKIDQAISTQERAAKLEEHDMKLEAILNYYKELKNL